MNSDFSLAAAPPAFTWDQPAQFEVPEEFRSLKPAKPATYTERAILPPPRQAEHREIPGSIKQTAKYRNEVVGQHYTPEDEPVYKALDRGSDSGPSELRLHDSEGRPVASFLVSPYKSRGPGVASVIMTKLAGRMQGRGLGRALYLAALHHLPYEWFHSGSISKDARVLRRRLFEKGLLQYHPHDDNLVSLTDEGHQEAERLGDLHAPGVGFHGAAWRYGARNLDGEYQFSTQQRIPGAVRGGRPVRYNQQHAANDGQDSPSGSGHWYPSGQLMPTASDQDYGQQQQPMDDDEGGQAPAQPQGMPDQGGEQQQQMPQAAPPPPPPRDPVSLYPHPGEEPRHQVEAAKTIFDQPTGDFPHPDDEHGWAMTSLPAEDLPGALLHVLASRGHKFSEGFGRGWAQILGDEAGIAAEVPIQDVFRQATLSPKIQGYLRRYSSDPMGDSIAGFDTKARRTLVLAGRTLADNPGFALDFGREAALGLEQAMAPPPNPDLEGMEPRQFGEPIQFRATGNLLAMLGRPPTGVHKQDAESKLPKDMLERVEARERKAGLKDRLGADAADAAEEAAKRRNMKRKRWSPKDLGRPDKPGSVRKRGSIELSEDSPWWQAQFGDYGDLHEIYEQLHQHARSPERSIQHIRQTFGGAFGNAGKSDVAAVMAARGYDTRGMSRQKMLTHLLSILERHAISTQQVEGIGPTIERSAPPEDQPPPKKPWYWPFDESQFGDYENRMSQRKFVEAGSPDVDYGIDPETWWRAAALAGGAAGMAGSYFLPPELTIPVGTAAGLYVGGKLGNAAMKRKAKRQEAFWPHSLKTREHAAKRARVRRQRLEDLLAAEEEQQFAIEPQTWPWSPLLGRRRAWQRPEGVSANLGQNVMSSRGDVVSHVGSGRDRRLEGGSGSAEVFRTGSGKQLVRKKGYDPRGLDAERENENFLRTLGVPIPASSYPQVDPSGRDSGKRKIADFIQGARRISPQSQAVPKTQEHVVAHALIHQNDVFPRNSGNTLVDPQGEPWYIDSGKEGRAHLGETTGDVLRQLTNVDPDSAAGPEDFADQLDRIEPRLEEALSHLGGWRNWQQRREVRRRFKALRKHFRPQQLSQDAAWWQQQFASV